MKKTYLFAFCISILFLFTACSTPTAQNAQQATQAAQAVSLKIAGLKGPTSMGLAQVMQENTENEYTMYTGADEIVPLVVKGEVDIALVPANLAATLYQKTEGKIKVIDVNTLSVLEVVTASENIKEIGDLAGKTVYMTGKGTTPEYALRTVLEMRGLAMEKLTVEFKTEASEVVSALTQNPEAIGILPQPFASVALTQNETLKAVMHLGEQWDNAAQDGSQLVTGVTIARADLDAEAIQAFITAHAKSVQYVNENPAEAAVWIEEMGIVKAAIAEKAIPSCNLVCLTGGQMQTALSGYLQALYDIAPDAVGGALPDEAFYDLGE